MTRWRIGIALIFVIFLAGMMDLDAASHKIIDLSYSLDADTIYWPTETGFVLEKEFEGMTEKGYFYAANKFSSPEHGGTHLDAPIHFSKGGLSVDQISPSQLVGAAVLVDVSVACSGDRDYQVGISDFTAWEKQHGKIPAQTILLIRTGFGKFWPDRRRYLGTDERGQQAVAKLHFPGLGPEAARWLVEQRQVKAVGLDTASIDFGQSKLFESHRSLAANNIPIFENLANLEQLPAKDFEVFALPMKIRGGSGAPLRAIAILPF